MQLLQHKRTKNIKYETYSNLGPLTNIQTNTEMHDNTDCKEIDKEQIDNEQAVIQKDIIYSLSNRQQQKLQETLKKHPSSLVVYYNNNI